MEECTIELMIFVPRLGHESPYTLKITHQKIELYTWDGLTHCEWSEGQPKWLGYSLVSILTRHQVFAPAILPRLIERAWGSWRNMEIDDAALARELRALAIWQNEITSHMPRGEFWEKSFREIV